MHSRPDLDTLLQDEGTSVEWKRNVADVEGVVKTLSAFANDYKGTEGGWVICGIEESKDEHGFSTPRPVGLEASRLKELKNKVPAFCRQKVEPSLVPEVHEVPVHGEPSRRILVFHVAASNQVHWVRTKKDGRQLWYRADSHTVQASNDIIAALMRAKGPLPQFVDEPCREAGVDDLEPRLVEELLEPFHLPRPALDYLQPDVPVDSRTPPLVVWDASTGRPLPRRFAVLLCCRHPHSFIRGASAVMTVYPGSSRADDYSQRFGLEGPLPALIDDTLAKLQLHTGYDIEKSAGDLSRPQNRPRFARRALIEAVVNAFVHRDYESPQPVRIDVFSDRIEIWNPTGPMRGLDPARLSEGEVRPSWQNLSLVSFTINLGLAQNVGQGLPTIIRESQRVTGKRPAFRVEQECFGVVLPALQPLLVPASPSAPRAGLGRPGILLISIGAPSIRAAVESSRADLGLEDADVLVDFSTGYIEPDPSHWLAEAKKIRNQLRDWVEDRAHGALHLFYRGPVVMAPLIGALVASVKPLVLYHMNDTGQYFHAFTLDRRFLHSSD